MAVQIPVEPGNPLQSFQTTLLGQSYEFVFAWNARDSAWYFDIAESGGKSILRSVKIVLGTLLGQNSTHELFRGRALLAYDTSGDGREASLDDLGTRVLLIFMSPADRVLAEGPAFELPEDA